jgi:hypothetical protein
MEASPTVVTYVESDTGVGLEPIPNTKLLFKALLFHRPGIRGRTSVLCRAAVDAASMMSFGATATGQTIGSYLRPHGYPKAF